MLWIDEVNKQPEKSIIDYLRFTFENIMGLLSCILLKISIKYNIYFLPSIFKQETAVRSESTEELIKYQEDI